MSHFTSTKSEIICECHEKKNIERIAVGSEQPSTSIGETARPN